MAVLTSPTPSPTPVVVTHDVFHTVIQYLTPHVFQLAMIVQFLGTGAGLSILHSIFLSNRLPKWANVALPIGYSGLAALADIVVRNTINWNDWYMVFVQVVTGAVAWYAVLTVVNKANASSASGLPTTTTP